ncbi:MAG TPA: class I SAM-dependent methyltransferase [Polyangiaceae bacterium]|jgi:ubiquinone/menaquinone biosynthesis C-methylase UbiE
MLWVGYTTRYRGGSAEFARAARTLRDDLARRRPGASVVLDPLVHKRDFVVAMRRIADAGETLDELHFLGHSGMYGIMFGSTAWPEQLSPHEWRALAIPFAPGASAHFHACRTARWFAPFFARTFGVRTYGNHGYTTVSARPDRFAWRGSRPARDDLPTYLVCVPGRKTHGIFGALRKYVARPPAEPMTAFDPAPAEGETGYDAVAALYDRAFTDIRVRRDEWRWLTARLDAAYPASLPSASKPRVLDLGCGNGALLLALRSRIASGAGVDLSPAMVACASGRARHAPHLSFHTVSGPALPFPDASFDVVTSFLSFRYLDWDPMMAEIRRVLAPGGRVLIVDMVEKALGALDAPRFVRSAAMHALRHARDRRFVRDVARLTSHPAWRVMLRHNPIRAEHEYRWYLESRFPGARLVTLNVGRTQRLVAFDTGPRAAGPVAPLSYP